MSKLIRPKSVQSHVSSSSIFRELAEKIDILHGIEVVVQDFSKNNLLPSLNVLNFRQNILVVSTHSAALAIRIKPKLPILLSYLRQKGYPQIMSIDLKIDPNAIKTKKPS
jgi:hypothetical protein